MPTDKRARQKAARRQKLEAQRRMERRQQLMRRGVIVAIVAAVIIGSVALFVGTGTTTTTTSRPKVSSSTTTTTVSASVAAAQRTANAKAVAAGCPASPSTRVNNLQWSKAPAMTISKTGTYYAHITTTAGDIVIKLDPAEAPITVNNFVFLARHDFYNCVIFHRVIPGFVIQGGDPTGTGQGGPGYTIADEYPKAGNPTYPEYSVAMANTGAAHTGGSQFFIVTAKNGGGLSNTYSRFGTVVSGFATVAKINSEGDSADNGDPPLVTQRMLKVTISSTP